MVYIDLKWKLLFVIYFFGVRIGRFVYVGIELVFEVRFLGRFDFIFIFYFVLGTGFVIKFLVRMEFWVIRGLSDFCVILVFFFLIFLNEIFRGLGFLRFVFGDFLDVNLELNFFRFLILRVIGLDFRSGNCFILGSVDVIFIFSRFECLESFFSEFLFFLFFL